MDGLERNFTAKRDDFNFPICDLFHFYEPNSSSTFLVVKLISSFRSKSNSMGVTSRAGTCFPLGAPDFTSVLLVGFVLLNQLDCLSFKLRLLFPPLGPSNFLKTNWVI